MTEPTDVTIDPTLLDAFLHGFYGYGSWTAKHWFIGMEEGGGTCLDEVAKRIRIWDQRGRAELEDLRDYHQALGITAHFGPAARIQATWGKLARIALAAEGHDSVDKETVRDFQRHRLGRHGGSAALIELLPLPSPSTAHWLYATLGIPSLATRKAYRDSLAPAREQALRQKIAAYHPDAVVFYGMAYIKEWKCISGADFVEVPGQRFLIADSSAQFFLAPHPAARGVKGSAYDAIGKCVRREPSSGS
jgi:hypothetical protein